MTVRAFPGFVNAHTHLYSGLAPLGLPVPSPAPTQLGDILRQVWWRLDRALDEDALAAAARLALAEGLLAGTTAVVDHHESPACIDGSLDVIAKACDELGVVAVLCYGATERNGGRDEARAGLEECRRFITSNTRRRVRGVVGVHAPFTVSDETLADAAGLARDLGTVVHLHVAEGVLDGQDARRRGDEGVVARLLRLDALPEGSIVAHGIHLERSDVAALAERGCWFVQNPRSNRGNGVGYPLALAAATDVALGTDGFPADLHDEIQAAWEDGARYDEPPDLAPRRALAGTRLLEQLGEQLWDGAPPVSRAERGRVTVDGRLLVEDGTLRSADLDAVRAEASRRAGPLWSRMEALS